tara:strand:- start:296 stop:1270 length:975 start_codon:yes stop_codon:yes gene_type:complete
MAAKGSLSRNLITGGCSFTAHKTRETLAWAEQLEEKYDNVINTAEMASGNQIICDRICYELSKPEVTSENTAVAVMWSSPYRKEFLFTYDDPDYTEIWQKFKDKIGFSNYILTDKQHEKHSTSNWLIVGGGYGIWNYEVTPLDARLKNYFTDIYNPEEAYVSTLRAMITVQALCEAKKIPLLNMCWQNVFHDLGSRDFESEQSFWKKDIVSTTGWLYTRLRTAFSNRLRDKGLLNEQEMKSDMHNKRIDRLYPNTKHWFELIDWGTWHFYENELIQKGGLQEFAHFECKVKSEDLNKHPSTKTQVKWRKRIMKELEERYGVEEI